MYHGIRRGYSSRHEARRRRPSSKPAASWRRVTPCPGTASPLKTEGETSASPAPPTQEVPPRAEERGEGPAPRGGATEHTSCALSAGELSPPSFDASPRRPRRATGGRQAVRAEAEVRSAVRSHRDARAQERAARGEKEWQLRLSRRPQPGQEAAPPQSTQQSSKSKGAAKRQSKKPPRSKQTPPPQSKSKKPQRAAAPGKQQQRPPKRAHEHHRRDPAREYHTSPWRVLLSRRQKHALNLGKDQRQGRGTCHAPVVSQKQQMASRWQPAGTQRHRRQSRESHEAREERGHRRAPRAWLRQPPRAWTEAELCPGHPVARQEL